MSELYYLVLYGEPGALRGGGVRSVLPSKLPLVMLVVSSISFFFRSFNGVSH